MAEQEAATAYRYVAFITYSHEDRLEAVWLHRVIERYRVPRRIRDTLLQRAPDAARLKPVFLDREELSSSADLAGSVRAALHQSGALIVLCSPAAARSRWVDQEIREFCALGRSNRVFCVLVRGEPATGERGLDPELECFPRSLRYDAAHADDVPRPEPLAADLRAGRVARREVRLRIVAGLLGVPFDDLRRRDQARHQRRLALVAGASFAASIAFASLAMVAWLARNEADRQRQIAQQKSMTAQRTTDFMVSLFQLSDPGEARGNTVTAREILDRGAQQIAGALADQPAVKAELTTTLGKVYTGLGLFVRADEMLAEARAIPGQSPLAEVNEDLALGELAFQRGKYDDAGKHLDDARSQVEARGVEDRDIRIRLLLARGDLAALQEKSDDATARFDAAQALMDERERNGEYGVHALEGRALATSYSDRFDEARTLYEQALAARLALSGDTHPKYFDSLNQLGTLAYQEGDTARAARYFEKVLDVDRRVLGSNHPAVAQTMLNLGRIRLERREYGAANDLFDRAVRLIAAQSSETSPDLVYGYSNEALARMGLGRYREAAPLLERALAAARINDHDLQGPIQVYQAMVACRLSRTNDGLRSLKAARPLIAVRYPDDAWRMAQLETVRAECLADLGNAAEAVRLIEANLPIVLKRWPPKTAMGADGIARAIRIYTLSGDNEKRERYRAMMP